MLGSSVERRPNMIKAMPNQVRFVDINMYCTLANKACSVSIKGILSSFSLKNSFFSSRENQQPRSQAVAVLKTWATLIRTSRNSCYKNRNKVRASFFVYLRNQLTFISKKTATLSSKGLPSSSRKTHTLQHRKLPCTPRFCRVHSLRFLKTLPLRTCTPCHCTQVVFHTKPTLLWLKPCLWCTLILTKKEFFFVHTFFWKYMQLFNKIKTPTE